MSDYSLNPSTNYVGCISDNLLMRKVATNYTFEQCKNLAQTQKNIFFGLQNFNGRTADCLFSISNDKNAFWNKIVKSNSCQLTITDATNYGIKTTYDNGISLYSLK